MTKCVDCGICVVAKTGLVENYMVHDDVWQDAGLSYLSGFICVACIERRLEHALTAADLDTTMPVNWPGQQRDTPRLFALKMEAVTTGMIHHLGFCWCGTAHVRLSDIPKPDMAAGSAS